MPTEVAVDSHWLLPEPPVPAPNRVISAVISRLALLPPTCRAAVVLMSISHAVEGDATNVQVTHLIVIVSSAEGTVASPRETEEGGLLER